MDISDVIATFAALIAFASFLVSLSAIVLTIWQGHETRKHYRKSAVARLSLDVNVSHRDADDFGITLNSVGLGPAVITGIEVLLNGKPSARESRLDWGRAWAFAGFTNTKFAINDLVVGTMLRPGQSVPMMVHAGDSITDDEIVEFLTAAQRVDLIVSYESLYGDSQKERLQCQPDRFVLPPAL